MRVIGMATVAEYIGRSFDRLQEAALVSWVAEAKAARWSGPSDVARSFPTSFSRGDEVIFPIGSIGRAFVTRLDYRNSVLLIRGIERLESWTAPSSLGALS
jgi:mRNA-degrading endonuclease HigB of HigAB toxin-antitoxin module